jgi:hypothetical protein
VRRRPAKCFLLGTYCLKSMLFGDLADGVLPGTLRIAEVDPNRSRAGETIWEEEVSDEDYSVASSVASFRGQD